MKQALTYLARFQQAQTVIEKEAVVIEFTAFFAELDAVEQQQATAVVQKLWPGVKQKVDELDELMKKAKERLQMPVHRV